MVALVFSCKNRGHLKHCGTNATEKSKILLNEYFSSHSYVLVFVFAPEEACEICILNILNRLNYVNNEEIQVYIYGLADDSDVPYGFVKFPNYFENASEIKIDKPYLCIVDSSFIASHYFIPEYHKPHLLENYLKEIIPMLSEKPLF
jgi:hypothetical protein